MSDEPASPDVVWHPGLIGRQDRVGHLGHAGATVWLTGLSGSGKSTVATELERRLVESGRPAYVLDGDNLRHGLTRDLGFTPDARRENVRRVAEAAKLMNDAGLVVVTALISPYEEDRAMARGIIGAERFFETYLSAGIEACERRDPKGLYAKARRGEIPEFTGVSAPYEAPAAPAIELPTGGQTVEQSVDALFAAVMRRVELPR